MLDVVRVTVVIACASLLGAAPAPEKTGAPKTGNYPIAGHGALLLAFPATWIEEIHPAPGDLPPTIEYSPPEGNEFSLQVTPLWSPGEDPEFNRPDTIRALLQNIAARSMDAAVETEIVLQEVKGPSASGYLFTLTDRAPAEGEWKYMTNGAVGVGDLLVSFTLLTHVPDSPTRRAAIRVLETARQAPAKAAPATSPPPAPRSSPGPAATSVPSPTPRPAARRRPRSIPGGAAARPRSRSGRTRPRTRARRSG